MFDVYCPSHDGRVLLGPRTIDAFVYTPDGVVLLHWRCHCGARGAERFVHQPAASTADAAA
jgi:hypothetical protein